MIWFSLGVSEEFSTSIFIIHYSWILVHSAGAFAKARGSAPHIFSFLLCLLSFLSPIPSHSFFPSLVWLTVRCICQGREVILLLWLFAVSPWSASFLSVYLWFISFPLPVFCFSFPSLFLLFYALSSLVFRHSSFFCSHHFPFSVICLCRFFG